MKDQQQENHEKGKRMLQILLHVGFVGMTHWQLAAYAHE